MSENLQVTGRTNSAVLPGFTLSELDIEHFEQLEQEFANQYRANVVKFVMGQSVGVAERFIDAAERLISENHFRYGGFAFDARAKSLTSIPLLLQMSLSIKHSDVTREKARALYRGHQSKPDVQRAVLDLMGYDVSVKNARAGMGSTGSTPEGEQSQSHDPAPGPGSPSNSANPA